MSYHVVKTTCCHDVMFHRYRYLGASTHTHARTDTHTHTQTHTVTHNHFTALLEYLRDHAGDAGTRKVKPNLDLLQEEILTGSGICWAICKSAPHPRQPHQHPTTQLFTGRMPFLPPNQQRQSTEGNIWERAQEAKVRADSEHVSLF